MVLPSQIYHLDPLLITSLPAQILSHTKDAFGLITASKKKEFGNYSCFGESQHERGRLVNDSPPLLSEKTKVESIEIPKPETTLQLRKAELIPSHPMKFLITPRLVPPKRGNQLVKIVAKVFR